VQTFWKSRLRYDKVTDSWKVGTFLRHSVGPNCALLGGFAIGARVSLLWQHSPNAKCQRVLVLALCLVIIIIIIIIIITARATLHASSAVCVCKRGLGSRKSVRPSVCPSVRPSVCPSHACFVANPKKTYRRYFYTTRKGNHSGFLMPKISAKFQRGHPQRPLAIYEFTTGENAFHSCRELVNS